jgi:hypothetical protein
MKDTAKAIAPGTPADSRWIRALRVLSLASLLFLVEPFALISIQERVAGLFTLLLLTPLWLAYLGVAVRVGGGKQAEALTTAVTFAPAAFVIGLTAALFIKFNPDWNWVRAYFHLFAASQLPLVVSAFGAYYSIQKESRPGRTPIWSLVRGLVLVVIMLVLSAFVIPGWVSSRYHSDQARVVYMLRSIQAAASTYQQKYGNGFPFHRDILAPPRVGTPAGCNAAGLIQPAVSSRRSGGYVFEFWPGPRVRTPQPGCVPGVQSFRITARPLEFGRTGTSSFFCDETGIVRQTSEDRSAGPGDPPVK